MPNSSNLLYPKEDVEHKQLIFLCRSCDHLQYADPYSIAQNCVDRINYNFRSKEDVNSYIAQGLDLDPTLPRANEWKCPNCPNVGAVYFQLPERVADDAMTLVFVCTECTFYQVKGKETSNDIQYNSMEETVSTLSEQQAHRGMLSDTPSTRHESRMTTHHSSAAFAAPSMSRQDKFIEAQHAEFHSKLDVDIGLDELGLGCSGDDDDDDDDEVEKPDQEKLNLGEEEEEEEKDDTLYEDQEMQNHISEA